MHVLGDLFSRINAQKGVLFPEGQVRITMNIIIYCHDIVSFTCDSIVCTIYSIAQ